jgi:hypothetical protein
MANILKKLIKCDVAMKMLQDVIIRHEIGGLTADTFQETLIGNHMELFEFTRSVLHTVGKVL